MIKVTEQDATGALTQETNYSYNLLDKLTGVNQGGQLRSYKYDAIGRLLFEKIPEQTPTIADGGVPNQWTTAYAYTEFNSLKKKTDARGVESHYSFDALHRVTQTWYTGLGGNDSGTVRPSLPNGVAATGDVTLGYSGWGAISSVTVGSNYSESYTFDDQNRPASMTRTIDSKPYLTSYENNGGGQQTKIIYPSGRVLGLGYDDFGRLKGLPYDSHVPAGPGYVTGMTYNMAGQVSGLTLGNGVSESFGYDPNRMQLITYNATAPGGGFGGLMQLSYVYQATAGQSGAGTTAGNAGQLTALFGTIAGIPEGASYSYDVVGRLTTSYTGTNNQSAYRRYGYDRWGNRTGVWDAVSGGNQIQSVTLEQSGGAPTNRIASVTNNGSTVSYLYDAVGNLINDGVHNYQYDAENRLVSVDNGATAQYRYDQQNRRVSKTVGTNVTHYVWEGTKVIAEHNGSTGGVITDYVYFGTSMIAKVSGGATQYFLRDHLSLRVVLDTSGNVLSRQAHLPFGEDFAASGTQEKHHFTSYERDGEGGTDYAVNRQYSQAVGRFMRVDPYGESSNGKNPQSWNRYTYTLDDPTNNVDPEGLVCDITFHLNPNSPLLGNYPLYYRIWPRYVSYATGPHDAPPNGDETSWWFYTYEVFISFPFVAGSDNFFGQDVKVVENWIGRDVRTHELVPVFSVEPWEPDDPEDGAWQGSICLFFPCTGNWVDTPGFRQVTKHKANGKKYKLRPWGGSITWKFRWYGYSNYDPPGTLGCERRANLTITFNGFGDPTWRWDILF